MSRIVIDIPDDARRKAATRAAAAGHPSVEDYVRSLLLDELAGPAAATTGDDGLEMDDDLEQLIADRIDNEEGSVVADEAFFDRLREFARKVGSGEVKR